MRAASFGLVTCLAALTAVATPAGAQEVFLQNDNWGGGALSCYTGVGDSESLANKLTAAPGQYPYTINRIRVFGCGGGSNPYNVFIYQDNGSGVNPGPLIWQSANSYILTGSAVFNDILMSSEPVPPPPITSGTVRVEIYNVFGIDSIGFGADLAITPQRNFLRPSTGVWSFAETLGVTGDWILRLGILPPASLPALSILDVTVPEGNSGTSQATFTVTLSPAASVPVTVHYATSDGTATAGSDYVATSGDLTFAIGQTVATFPVTINGDVTDEPDETFTVTLSDPVNAIIDRGEGLGTITDDDPAPALSVNDVTVTEGDTGTVSADFTVSLSGLTERTVTVQYATADGTATAPGDYLSASGTLTFAPGQTTRPVSVSVNGDLVHEPSETFFLNLSVPVNATIADGQGVGTIVDNDGFRFHTVPPCRVVDTRSGSPLSAGADRTVPVTGLCLVPSTATAVAVNLTVTQPTNPGSVTLFPAGTTLPATSSINYRVGQTRANNGVFGLGTAGALVAHCGQAAGTTHFILDVYGYFE
jgi:hypothetical protein